MKVLITTDTYFPMINGVVTSINNLYKELKESGHEVKVLTLSHNGDEQVLGDIYYLKSVGVKIYPNARIKVPFYNKLIKSIIDWKPDIIHSQTEFSTMLAAKHIANKLNIPIVHTYHTLYEDYLGYIFGGKIINKNTAALIIKSVLNNVNAIIAPTEKAKNALLNYGISKKTFVIPTGIELNKFKYSVEENEKYKIYNELGIDKNHSLIAYVGRIAEEKNIDEIIALFPRVLEKNNNVKLLIVGGGPYLQNLKDQVEAEGLKDSVIFTGMIKPEEIYKYYKIAEIFVTASTSETQGLTYIEALSCGCPIVCKWDSCIDGLISQGENGFSYKESWQFAHFINEILQNQSLKTQMKLEAIKKANEYSSDIFKNKVLAAYCDIISNDANNIAV